VRRRLRSAPLLVLALPTAPLAVVAAPEARAASTTALTVDGIRSGRTFDGSGAISGGGTTAGAAPESWTYADNAPLEILSCNGTGNRNRSRT
jgi:hypothetical protein